MGSTFVEKVLALKSGKITNTRTNEGIPFDSFPDFTQVYLEEGGPANYVRNRLAETA